MYGSFTIRGRTCFLMFFRKNKKNHQFKEGQSVIIIERGILICTSDGKKATGRISYSQFVIPLLQIDFFQSLNRHYIQSLVNLERIQYSRAEKRDEQNRGDNWLKGKILVNNTYLLLFGFPNKPLFTIFAFIVVDEKGSMENCLWY